MATMDAVDIDKPLPPRRLLVIRPKHAAAMVWGVSASLIRMFVRQTKPNVANRGVVILVASTINKELIITLKSSETMINFRRNSMLILLKIAFSSFTLVKAVLI